MDQTANWDAPQRLPSLVVEGDPREGLKIAVLIRGEFVLGTIVPWDVIESWLHKARELNRREAGHDT